MAMNFEEVSYEYDATFSEMGSTTSTCLTYTDISCHASSAYDSVSSYASGIDWTSLSIHAVAAMLLLSVLGMLGGYFAYYIVRVIINRRKNASGAAQPVVAKIPMHSPKSGHAVSSHSSSGWSFGYVGKLPVIVKRIAAPILKLMIRALYMICQIIAWTLVKIGALQKKCVEYHAAMTIPQ